MNRLDLDTYIVSNISDNKFFGDRNQSIAIRDALHERLKPSNMSVKTHEVDCKDVAKLANNVAMNNNLAVVISSGEHGIDAFHKLNQNQDIKDKMIKVWSGHHIFKNLEQHLGDIDIIALPEYVITYQFSEECKKNNIPLVYTATIPISITEVGIKKSYNQFAEKDKIPLDSSYVVVFFGGDAPDEGGKMHKITPSEIKNLAAYTSKIALKNNAKIVVTNNPRTKKEQMEQFFMELNKHHVENVVFFDFHAGIRSYEALLHLIKSGVHSRVIVTGESTSMIDEVIQVTNKPIYVLKASNMSGAHTKHIEYEELIKNISVLDAKNAESTIEELPNSLELNDNPADPIIDQIENALASKCNNSDSAA